MTDTLASRTSRYSLGGILLGLCFPIGSVAYLYTTGALPAGDDIGALFRNAHLSHPLLYVIDTSPFTLGLFAYWVGSREERILRFSESLEIQVAEKTASLQQALAEAQKANEMIAHLAEHDSLTGLMNRRRFQKELDRWSSHALRYQRQLALIFLDLDQFKLINDKYGHKVGDMYLVAVSELFKEAFRTTDYLARWGGDEFAILLPETSREGATEVANKLVKMLNEARLPIEGHELQLSGSVGLALFPEHTTQANELVACADAAMYTAKENGRNSWHLYSASANETQRVQEHIRWEARIRTALETDQFVLLYQPVLDLRTNETRDYEALLRMEDRDGHLIPAASFMNYAEQFKLSIPIDRMVIRKAVRRISGLLEEERRLSLSINLSRKSLHESDLLSYLDRTLTESDISPARLGIEITAQATMENLGLCRELISRFRELGCRVIFDDFGLGHLSFHYLQQVAVDCVKIDGALIRNIRKDAESQRFIRSISNMAHDLGIKTIAKHVEDLSLLDTLRGLGIDYAQGFAVGRPLESLEQVMLEKMAAAS